MVLPVAAVVLIVLLVIDWALSRTVWRSNRRSYFAVQGPAGNEQAHFWVVVAISLVTLLPSLFVVLSGHYGEDTQKWAFGIIGTILGYWLKG
jgi:hypothetical protein